jgi:hypothetical protein
LHEVTQGALKELARSSHSWIPYFAVGDGHGSSTLEGSKEKKRKRIRKTTYVVYYIRHKLSKHLASPKETAYAYPLTSGF